MKKLRVGILGATGMVGQQFIVLLANHPWFEITCLAASPQSAGKSYQEAVKGKWNMDKDIPHIVKNILVMDVEKDAKKLAKKVDVVFCALDMQKEDIKRIENLYASLEVPVVSNNSANRWTDDVPMIMPEINPDHLKLIDVQRKNRGWKKGLIAVKPNCSIQSYVSIVTALKNFIPQKIKVTSLQAISGAGKTFGTWPEMLDNVIPYIGDEELKSEKEPMKIWGTLKNNSLHLAKKPHIDATCIRVAVSHGHMASVSLSFEKRIAEKDILQAIEKFNKKVKLDLPSAPKKFITYFEEENVPQTKLHRNIENGMGISMGRLRKGKLFDWEFIALAHNTIRGAAGGAILMAELLVQKGYI